MFTLMFVVAALVAVVASFILGVVWTMKIVYRTIHAMPAERKQQFLSDLKNTTRSRTHG